MFDGFTQMTRDLSEELLISLAGAELRKVSKH